VLSKKLPRLAVPAAFVATAIVVGSAWLSGGASGAPAAAARTPRSGVVLITTRLAVAGETSAGTGIVLTSSGRVLSNNHVIRGATSVSVTTPNGHSYPATVQGYSISKDVALLKLSGARGLVTASIGDSNRVQVGQSVTAVGNAGGSGSLSVVTGKIVDTGRVITVTDSEGNTARLTNMIETSAPLVPGDSGGPLLLGGRVIGIDAAGPRGFRFESGSDGFAIPINTAVSLAGQIQSGRRSSTVHVGPTAFLGVALAAPDASGGRGAAVEQVVAGSPADRAGIAPGDVLTAIGGRTVTNRNVVRNVLLQTSPGRPLRVKWTDGTGVPRAATVRPVSGPPQ
jgi:S1-C subfamily serine protease